MICLGTAECGVGGSASPCPRKVSRAKAALRHKDVVKMEALCFLSIKTGPSQA
jgi:hypothetical protein